MDKLQEKLSIWSKNKKLKLILVVSSFSLLAVFNIPLILWAWEKYLQKDKIGKRPKYEHDIEQLFEQLWYPDHAQTLCIYEQDDIDLVHLKWSQETMENLLHQFWSMKEEIQSDTISIPWSWTSYKKLNKYHNYVKLESIYNCEVINEIQNTLQLNENETIVILSLLMNLWLSENVEESQAHDWSVRNISASGYNRVDLRGNIAWVVANMENNKLNIDMSDISRILWILQQRYHTIDAKSILTKLSEEFDLWMKIKNKK